MLEDTLLLIIDVQDKLLNIIPEKEKLLSNIVLLAEYYKGMNLPTIATRQVKLGEITSTIKEIIGDKPVYEKKYFSIMKEEEIRKKIEETGKTTIVLTGIETHICILQSAIDLLNESYNVIIPYDAVASQIHEDHVYALRFLEKNGALILPTETLIYASMQTPEHPLFKKMLGLVKERRRKYMA